jgi:hypothetical protein
MHYYWYMYDQMQNHINCLHQCDSCIHVHVFSFTHQRKTSKPCHMILVYVAFIITFHTSWIYFICIIALVMHDAWMLNLYFQGHNSRRIYLWLLDRNQTIHIFQSTYFSFLKLKSKYILKNLTIWWFSMSLMYRLCECREFEFKNLLL